MNESRLPDRDRPRVGDALSRLARSFALAALALIAACIASPVHGQTPGRVATTIEAAIAEPVFFHGRQIAIRAATIQDRSGTRVVVGNSAAGDKPKLASGLRLLATDTLAERRRNPRGVLRPREAARRRLAVFQLRLPPAVGSRVWRPLAESGRGLRHRWRDGDRRAGAVWPQRSRHRAPTLEVRGPRRHRDRPIQGSQSLRRSAHRH